MPSDQPLQPVISLGRLEPAKSAGSALPSRALQPALPPSADWRRYLVAIRRYKWIVLAGSLLGGGAGFAAGRYLGSEYTARATIWIDVPDPRIREEGPLWTGQLRISSGWTDLLETSAVLESVVRERRLYLSLDDPADSAALRSFRIKGQVRPGTFAFSVAELDPTFTLSSEDGVHEQGSLGDSVGADLGFLWVPAPDAVAPGHKIVFTVAAPSDAAKLLAKALVVKSDLDDNFIQLELRGSSPTGVAGIVNAVADRFEALATELKRRKLTELTGILSEQLKQAQGKLAEAEAALKRFRVTAVTQFAQGTAAVTPNLERTQDPGFAGLLELKVSREQVRHDREALRRVLAQARDSGLSVDALGMIGAVQRSLELSEALKGLTAKQAELRAVRFRYTDATPAVRHLAEEVKLLERQTIPRLATALMNELAVRESEVGRDVDSASGNLRRVSPLAVEEAALQRDVTSAEQLVTNIRQRYEEARLADVSSIPDVRILDRAAVPFLPAFNLLPVLVVLGLMGGFGAGGGAAVLLDHLDRKVREPDEVTRVMGLPILGAVPHLKQRRNGSVHEGGLPIIEAIRGIRLSVQYAHGAAGPLVCTITSPGRSDGKSFLASNLALGLADAGLRTVLIDGDIRRGALHRVLAVARKPGLTDVLAGKATVDEVVRATAFPRVSFVPCGTRRFSGPELLGSPAMRALLANLRGRFDAVLVDSPPLDAGVDAYLLGTLTANLLLVLRTGVTDRELAAAKLGVLDRLPVRVLGAVLNDVEPRGAYRYYSYSLEGYELKEEQDPDDEGAAARVLVRSPK